MEISPFRLQLANVLKRHRKSEVALALGYRHISEKFIARLNRVVSDDCLGLDAGGYDFKHSDESFLRALCKLAGIGGEPLNAEIRRIHDVIQYRKAAFMPTVFIDTGFKRVAEPVFLLAVSERLRWLSWPLRFADLSDAEQLEAACTRVKEHYAEANGQLLVWGAIQRYVFQYNETHAWVIDVDGNVVDEEVNFKPDSAALLIGGKRANEVLIEADEKKASSAVSDSFHS